MHASKDVNVVPAAPLLASPVSWDAASSIVLEGDSEGSFIKEVPEATAVAGQGAQTVGASDAMSR
ncbi:unnamed protein product [Symbiodinium necroappetens]|uniref:Uncharacterized protein n=1 Tax=Symbiodinium necroappetens TaxID=1628268 RepID=A0A812TJU2_9DINO|nr:unnamed protein product [Symbiodinium necroappetens]